MVASVNLPSQFELIHPFEETLGFYRVADKRSQSRMLLLRICGSDQFNDSMKGFCQNWMRQNLNCTIDGVWIPNRILITKQAGTFVVFDDVSAITLEDAVRANSRLDAPTLIQVLKQVAGAVDRLHQQLTPHGNLSSKTILITDDNAGLIPDLRLLQELNHRLGVSTETRLSIQNDRLAFADILDAVLDLDGSSPSSSVRVPSIADRQVRDSIKRLRSGALQTCSDCLSELEEILRKPSAIKGPTRWQMVVEFLDDDPNSAVVSAQMHSELPQIKSEAIAARVAVPSESAPSDQVTQAKPPVVPARGSSNPQKLPQTSEAQSVLATPAISPAPLATKPAGPSNKALVGFFLFSTFVLAGVIGYKFYLPRINASPAPQSKPVVTYTTQQIQEQATALTEAEQKAKNDFKLDQIAPLTWKQAQQEAETAKQFGQVNNSTDFMDSAAKAIDLFNQAESITKDCQAYNDLLKLVPVLKDDNQSVPPQIRQQENEEYQAAFRLLHESEESARKERFAEAAEKLKDARDRVARIEPQARLKAAHAATTPSDKLALLVPLLDRPDTSPEVVAIVCEVLDENPQLWLTEAKRRIELLGPVEALAATCELARAGHATNDKRLENESLMQAIKLVDRLPDTSTDPQAPTAVIRLLEVVGDYGTDAQRSQATSQAAKWAEANAHDSLDNAMIAGYCYRSGNLAAWERLTNQSLAKTLATDVIDDVVAVNFAIANSSPSSLPGLQALMKIAERAPMAAALTDTFALKVEDTQASRVDRRAEQNLPLLDRTNEYASRTHEIFSAMLAAQGEQLGATQFLPATRLTGLAAAMECRQVALKGDLDDALKRWDTLPQHSLLKVDAIVAIIQAGVQGRWKSADVVRWSMSRQADFDKAIACLIASCGTLPTATNAISTEIVPPKLQPGTVLVWKELVWSGKTSRTNLGFGAAAGGSNNSNSGRSAPVPKMRFFVRSIEGEAISGFLERTPGNELYYCTGTYRGGTLHCQAEALIPLNTRSASSKLSFNAHFTPLSGMAVRVAVEGGVVQPTVAVLDLAKNVEQQTPKEKKAIEELEARLLVSQMANGIGAGDEPNPVVQWSIGPIIVVRGTPRQKELAGESLQQLGDRTMKCPFASFKVRDAIGKNDSHGLILIFDKAEKHESNAKMLGLTWNTSDPMGYLITVENNDPNRVQGVLLQVDPAQFSEDQLRIALQHLWIKSLGYNIGHKSIALPVESSFTSWKASPDGHLKPLSPLDQKAIRIFLEEIDRGMDPQKVRWELFMRKKDLWGFP